MSTFVHMELNTSDPEAAKKFYRGVFGWKYQKVKTPQGVYNMVLGPDGPLGGMQQHPMPEGPTGWLGYVGVDSVKRTIAKVEKRGGKVIVPLMEVMGMGWMAIFEDPQGGVFAVWQTNPSAPRPDQTTSQAKKVAKTATKKKAAKKAAKKSAKKVAKKAAKKVAKKSTKKK